MKRVLQYVAGVVWMASLANGMATVRYVPTGGFPVYSTIQAAINWSYPGDIVQVAPGTYYESITFKTNMDITLTSVNPGDSNIVQTTVLQGDGTHSVVTFAPGQSQKTLFTGFTVRGGGGTVFPEYQVGGGIYCNNSSPSIVGNIIEENHAPAFNSFGGGIACWDCSPRIARNIIRNNSACWGGAINSRSGFPLIEDNWIYNNTATLGTGGAASLADRGKFLNNTLFENTPNNLEVETTYLLANNILVQSNASTIIGEISPWFKNNNVWVVGGPEILPAAGTNGNFSCDPLFVDARNFCLASMRVIYWACDQPTNWILMGARESSHTGWMWERVNFVEPRISRQQPTPGIGELDGYRVRALLWMGRPHSIRKGPRSSLPGPRLWVLRWRCWSPIIRPALLPRFRQITAFNSW